VRFGLFANRFKGLFDLSNVLFGGADPPPKQQRGPPTDVLLGVEQIWRVMHPEALFRMLYQSSCLVARRLHHLHGKALKCLFDLGVPGLCPTVVGILLEEQEV
jgi:hypothetical protein